MRRLLLCLLLQEQGARDLQIKSYEGTANISVVPGPGR